MGKNTDVRVVQLRNYDHISNAMKQANAGLLNYYILSYYDDITVHHVAGRTPEAAINAGYREVQRILETQTNECRSHQLMIAFADIDEAQSEKRIVDFWDEEKNRSALFFMSMVNVPTAASVTDAFTRIDSIFKGKEYLRYVTMEYNEILLFFRGNSFKEYSDLVMRLNFGLIEGMKNTISDTITICGFCGGSISVEDRDITALISVGTNEYVRLMDFLKSSHIAAENYWLLGRNDYAVCKFGASLEWLGRLFELFKAQENHDFITTLNLEILIPRGEDMELTDSCSFKTPNTEDSMRLKAGLELKILSLQESYIAACSRWHIKPNIVFLRILKDIQRLIVDLCNSRLAEDLIVCLLPEFLDFICYTDRVCRNGNLSEAQEALLTKCFNNFYLSVITLVNSTVHSYQQFVQIPHCGAPSFEMPPKIMAYYNIIVRKIADVLNDDGVTYGIVLSPKLINEIEVEQLSLCGTSLPDELLSINLSEESIYLLQRTVATFGHELSHFICHGPRNRALRKKQIIKYFTFSVLVKFLSEYNARLQAQWNIPLNSDAFLSLADDLVELMNAEGLMVFDNESGHLHLSEIFNDVRGLSHIIFANNRLRSTVFQRCMLWNSPNEDIPANNAFSRRARYEFEQSRLRSLFNDAVEQFLLSESTAKKQFELQNLFDEYIKYIFSETFADIGMILLFNMPLETYGSLISGQSDAEAPALLSYRTDSNFDQIELLRFICVSRALIKTGVWEVTETLSVPLIFDDADKRSVYWQAAQAVGDMIGDKFLHFLTKFDLDITLVNDLVPYLEACVLDLKTHFMDKAPLHMSLINLYNIISNTGQVVTLIEKIREMESDCLSELYAEGETV